MGAEFRRLFRDYYAIHETIHLALLETNGAPIKLVDIERRVREAHPDLDMGAATLAAAIRQAATDAQAAISD